LFQKNDLNLSIVNFVALLIKVEFESFLAENNINISIGTESHLDNSISSAKIFSKLLILIEMTEISMVVEPLFLLKPCTIPSSHIDISPSSEIIWVHLHNNQYSNIIVGSFYCPPPPAACTLDELSNFLAAVQQRFPHAKILLGGNFNVPGID